MKRGFIDKIINFYKYFKYYRVFEPEIKKYEYYAKTQKRINSICAFILTLFPVFITVLVLIQEHPALIRIFNEKEGLFLNVNNLLLLIILILAVIVIVVGIIHCCLSMSNDCFIAEAMEAEKLKGEMSECHTQMLSSRSETYKGFYTLGALDAIFCKAFHLLKPHGGDKNSEFEKFICFLVNTLYDALDAYKYEGEKFTVAIYIHNEIRDVLTDIKSKKHTQIIQDKISKQGEKNTSRGREWKRTDNSHVSLVFNETSGKIYGNLSKSIKPRPISSFPTDESNYVASITIPLAKNNAKDDAIKNRGVLCITSNIEDSFYDGEEYELCSIRERHITIIAKILEFILNSLYPENNQQILETLVVKKQMPETNAN